VGLHSGRLPLCPSTVMEVTDSDKHSSLLQNIIDYSCKKFYGTDSRSSIVSAVTCWSQ
jgi:hypothetical protein